MSTTAPENFNVTALPPDLHTAGSVDSATATTLTDADVFTTVDEYNGKYVVIVEGTGTDNGYTIITDTMAGGEHLITVGSWNGTQPDATSKYVIVDAIGDPTTSGLHGMMLTWTNRTVFDDIEIQYNSGSGWTHEDTIDGQLEYYHKTGVTINTAYYWEVRGGIAGAWSSWVSAPLVTCYSDAPSDSPTVTTESVTLGIAITEGFIAGDTLTESVTLGIAITEGGAWSEDLTETFTVTAFVLDTKSLKTNWGYYLTDSNGKIFEYSESYKNDDDTRISGYWQGKQADFSDQDNECLDASKIVYTARLYYKDLDADTIISVSLSTDGGTTWTSQSKTLGDGDGTIKSTDFSFRLNGVNFTPKVSNSSTDKRFQFINLELYYEVLGRYFSKT